MIVTRGLGRNGTAAALIVTLGLGIAAPVYDIVEPDYGDATGVVRIVRVSTETSEIVGIFVVGRTLALQDLGEVSIYMANDAIGVERLGFATIDPVPVAGVGADELPTATIIGKVTV